MGHGQGLFVEEPERQVEIEVADARIAQRSIDACRSRVDEDRHVEFHRGFPQRVEQWRVEGGAEIGADVRAHQPQVVHCPPELDRGCADVLHGQLGEPAEPVGVGSHDGCHLVVVPATEPRGDVGLDVMEIGDRVR